MHRTTLEFLKIWKHRKNHKPLIIRGARQVGKTFLVKMFASEFETFVEINFEENPEYKDFFISNDVESIIQNISLTKGLKISEGSTLLFLDEIQMCPEAITTLRYFYEKKPGLHVIAAGSLLDHVLNNLKLPMPVGRVEFLYMYPMSFHEFLIAMGEDLLVEFLNDYKIENELSVVVHKKLLKLLRIYFFVGGMPEAVKTHIDTSDFLEVERVHESILMSMEIDFAKYGGNGDQQNLRSVLKYIPRGIGKKMKWAAIDNTVKSTNLKQAFEKLERSRVIHRVSATSTVEIPLNQNIKQNVFKPLYADIGLARHILGVRLIDPEKLMLINEGVMAEQFIGQQLLCRKPEFIDRELYYWVREKADSNAEIDYLFEYFNQVLPVEIKAGKTGTLKSLHVFMKEKNKALALRFNADLPSKTDVKTSLRMKNTIEQVDYKLISLPLYLVNYVDNILDDSRT
jgi:predicted AAA+ superfamily ATPase